MQVTVESAGGLERRMAVVLPSGPIEQAFAQKLAERARSAHFNGFRPGKAPLKEVRRRFGKALRMEAAAASMEAAFQEAVRDRDIRLASPPAFDVGEVAANEDLRFTATFEVLPTITLGDFSQIKVERPAATVTDADVDDMVETLRQNDQRWHPVERPAAPGDRVRGDLAPCDGTEFQGEGVLVPVAGAFPMPGIAEAAEGMAAGDVRRIPSKFPEFMADEARRGKDAEFEFTVREVTEARLPELDEAFFAALGITEGGEARFRQEVREDLETRLAAQTRRVLREQVFKQLIAMHEFELPKAMLAQEREALSADMERRLGPARDEGGEELRQAIATQAERRLRAGLLVKAIVDRDGLVADGAKVRERVEGIARGYEHPEQVVSAYYQHDGLISDMEGAVLEEQVVEHVLSQAQVETVERSYREVLNPGEARREDGGTPPSDAASQPTT